MSRPSVDPAAASQILAHRGRSQASALTGRACVQRPELLRMKPAMNRRGDGGRGRLERRGQRAGRCGRCRLYSRQCGVNGLQGRRLPCEGLIRWLTRWREFLRPKITPNCDVSYMKYPTVLV